MRVESAGIILLFLLGVVSQLKLFKLIQKRREARKRVQRLRDEDREKEEGEVGRRVQDNIEREQARWESVYGDKTASPTEGARSTESINKDGVSHYEKRLSSDDMEMSDLSASRELKPDGSRQSSKLVNGATVTITVAADDEAADEIHEIDHEGNPIKRLSRDESTASRSKRSLDATGTSSAGQRASTAATTPVESARNSMRSSLPPPPVVVPLPFKVPVLEDEELREADDIASVATASESIHPMNSQRESRISSAFQRLSIGRSLADIPPSQEDLIVPHIEEDRRSSIAATIDALDEDEMSLPGDSSGEEPSSPLDAPKSWSSIEGLTARNAEGKEPRSSEEPQESWTNETMRVIQKRLSAPLLTPKAAEQGKVRSRSLSPARHVKSSTEKQETPTASPIESVWPRPEVPDKNPAREDKRRSEQIDGDTAPEKSTETQQDPSLKPDSGDKSPASNKRVSDSHSRREHRASLKSGASAGKSNISHSITQDSLSALPAPMSKVVMSYRTNEWAKHLSKAETPEPDQLATPPSPGVMVDTGFSQASQQRRSINPAGIVGGQEPQISYAGSNPASTPTSPQLRPLSAANMQETTDRAPLPLLRSSSYTAVQHADPSIASPQLSRQNSANVSRTSLYGKPSNGRTSRNFSTPLLSQTLQETPYENPSRMGTIKTVGNSLAPLPSDTLLDKRSSILQQRITTVGFNNSGFVSTPNFSPMSPISPSDSASIRNSVNVEESPDLDDIPLAERKAILEGRKRSVRSSHTFTVTHTQPAAMQSQTWAAASTANLQNFNSHQPKRDSGMDASKRETLLNSWRESLREELAPTKPVPLADDGRRAAMINERRQKQMMEQQHQVARHVRDSTFDNMMRRGDMLELHREALRKMQANAKTE
jgi:hypothetical protein